MSENVTHRLLAWIEAENLTQAQVENAIQAGNGLISSAKKKNTDLGVSWFQKIGRKYPNLNMNWLITGRGEMLLPGPGVAAPAAVAATDAALLAENIELLRENRQLRIQIEQLKEGRKKG
ncbi:MAG: hypothetical protein LCH58_05955 [Bacteroidetes bacterium]|nr:hypothetical protein [Bacteroidota bacterium]